MTKIKIYAILAIILLPILLTACYEDEGNYTYDESIRDISVKLDRVYGIRKSDEVMTYSITPKIITADGDKSYLKFTWMMSTQSSNVMNDTIGKDSTVTLTIDPTNSDFSYNYYLRLYVTNTLTNTVTMVPTELEITKPYSKAWAVLYETDGHAELGTVEYVGSDMMVLPHAYSDDTKQQLTGKPVSLSSVKRETYQYYFGYLADSQLFLTTTNLDESGLLNQAEKFKLMAKWQDLFAPEQKGDVDLNDFSTSSCANSGLLLCSKGHVFTACYYSPFMYEMLPNNTLTGNYHISKIQGGPHTALAFDEEGHRFVHLALQSMGDSWYGYNQSGVKDAGPIARIPYKEDLDSRNPSRIDEDEKVINIINGYHYEKSGVAVWQRYSAYAYALAPGNMSHVYVFRYFALTHTDDAILPSDYEFVTPEGIDENTPMTSGATYNNIIFYAVGNKVYKLDISTGNSTLIYQNEDTKAQITCLKMAMDGYGWSDDSDNLGADTYGHPYSRLLGVGVNLSDGSGELVVLQLNTAGKVDDDHKFPSTQVHKGFGKIKDIAFI